MNYSPAEQLSSQSVPLDRTTKGHAYFCAKRCCDMILSSLLLVLLLPVMATIALLIKLDSPGPVIFVQERVSSKPKPNSKWSTWKLETFSLYKFRTMRADVDQDLHLRFVTAYISGNEDEMAKIQPKPQSGGMNKLAGDPRVTRIGRFLRKTSLDELPQFFNVVRGDMSLVGPRPPLRYEVELYDSADMQRLTATPGMTGLWQISGRSETSFEEMVRLDIEYIAQQSLLLDLKIIVGTIPAVLSTKGAD